LQCPAKSFQLYLAVLQGPVRKEFFHRDIFLKYANLRTFFYMTLPMPGQ
jgi:hypothetical protein